MSKTTAGLITFLALLAIVAGLYAIGPKYVVERHAQTKYEAKVLCPSNRKFELPPLNMPEAQATWEGFCYGVQNAIGFEHRESADSDWWIDTEWDTQREAETYLRKYGNWPSHVDPRTRRWTTIRRAAAWERIRYAFVGSKNTRG